MIALLCVVYAFLRRWLMAAKTGQSDPEGAGRIVLLSTIALGATPFIALPARSATADAVLTLWITATILCLANADLLTRTGARSANLWYLAAAGCSGAGFLTKGPVAVVIPGAVWLAYHAFSRTLKNELRRPWIKSCLVFLLIAAPWYVAIYMVDGAGFFRHFFLRENVARFLTVLDGNGPPNRLLGLVTYVPVALVFGFPFSVLALRDLIRPFDRNQDFQTDDVVRSIRRWCWIWVAALFVVFSLSRTQLPSYILSMGTPIAVVFGLHVWARDSQASSAGKRAAWLQGLLLLLLAIFWMVVLLFLLLKGLPGPLGREPTPPPLSTVVGSLCVIAGGCLIYAVCRWGFRDSAYQALCAWLLPAWMALLLVAAVGVAPIIVRSGYLPCLLIGRQIGQIPRAEPALTWTRQAPESLVFYSGRRIEFHQKDREALLARLDELTKGGRTCLLVCEDASLLALEKRPGRRFTPILFAGSAVLLRVSGAAAGDHEPEMKREK